MKKKKKKKKKKKSGQKSPLGLVVFDYLHCMRPAVPGAEECKGALCKLCQVMRNWSCQAPLNNWRSDIFPTLKQEWARFAMQPFRGSALWGLFAGFNYRRPMFHMITFSLGASAGDLVI